MEYAGGLMDHQQEDVVGTKSWWHFEVQCHAKIWLLVAAGFTLKYTGKLRFIFMFYDICWFGLWFTIYMQAYQLVLQHIGFYCVFCCCCFYFGNSRLFHSSWAGPVKSVECFFFFLVIQDYFTPLELGQSSRWSDSRSLRNTTSLFAGRAVLAAGLARDRPLSLL